MIIFLLIIIYFLQGYWCLKIAESKGRAKRLAFLLGLVFGLFAIVGYALSSKTLEKEAEDQKKIEELKSSLK